VGRGGGGVQYYNGEKNGTHAERVLDMDICSENVNYLSNRDRLEMKCICGGNNAVPTSIVDSGEASCG